MRRWIIAAVLAAGLGAAWFLSRGAGADAESSRGVAATVGRVEESVETTGEVVPLNRVEMKPPISGRIEKLLVDEGSFVKAGQIVAWLSSADRAAILDAARAKGPEELARWEDTYKATPIVAPMSGTIILRNVVVGQTVDGGTVLFALADKLIVLARVDETDIGRVKPDMAARIILDAYPDSPIEGKVSTLLFEGKNVSNVITYGVKVEPKEVPPFFRSQMTANIKLLVRSREDAVLVPLAAINAGRRGGKRVMVPGPDGKPVPREVKTGSEMGDKVEILEGLEAGETVLIVRRRYSPQRANSSPLVMGGRPKEKGGGQDSGRGRRGGGGGN
ncbi:MAG: efflux RND transporter periplasmic adaptor subunit [Elusimicrobia bacterium]|nr:efflux RND transporter periplasmic adaptor subunit [Elusimicrobiota bacterium]